MSLNSMHPVEKERSCLEATPQDLELPRKTIQKIIRQFSAGRTFNLSENENMWQMCK